MTSVNRRIAALLLAISLGCAFTGCSSAPAARFTSPSAPRCRVYLFLGLAGVFSTGLETLGNELAQESFAVEVLPLDGWDEAEREIRDSDSHSPLVLGGHSFGADVAIRLAQRLAAAPTEPVALLLTLDPVTPPPVPSNVRRVVNLYQTNPLLDNTPFWHGAPLVADAPQETNLKNVDLRRDRPDLVSPDLSHGNMTNSAPILNEARLRVEQACAPRR